MPIFEASANDIPLQENERKSRLCPTAQISPAATSHQRQEKRASASTRSCLEEIQTFRNRLPLRNHEAANPTMPSPQTSRIWLNVDISGTGTGMTPTLSILFPPGFAVPSAAKYPGIDWPKFETAENVPSG